MEKAALPVDARIKAATTENLERFSRAFWNHYQKVKTVAAAQRLAVLHELVEIELTERHLGAM